MFLLFVFHVGVRTSAARRRFQMLTLCVCPPGQSSMETPNLEFEYGDTDALTAELSGTGQNLQTDENFNLFYPVGIFRFQEACFFYGVVMLYSYRVATIIAST